MKLAHKRGVSFSVGIKVSWCDSGFEVRDFAFQACVGKEIVADHEFCAAQFACLFPSGDLLVCALLFFAIFHGIKRCFSVLVR